MVCKDNFGDNWSLFFIRMVMSGEKLYTDRDYFDRMFASIDDNFVEVKGRLDKLNNMKIPTIEERLGCLEERNKIDDEIKKRWWIKYRRVIELIAVGIAFISLIVVNFFDLKLQRQVKQEVQTTNTYIAPVRSARQLADSILIRAMNYADSLKND